MQTLIFPRRRSAPIILSLLLSSLSLHAQDNWQWSSVSSGTTQHLRDLQMLNANYGVAVGSNSTVLLWNGTAWSAIPGVSATGFSSDSLFRAVAVLAEGKVLIGSYSSGTNSGISLWDGTAWQPKINGGGNTDHVGAFWTDGSGTILAARGAGRIFKYSGDGSTSSVMSNANWSRRLNFGSSTFLGIDGAQDGSVFAVGLSGLVYSSSDVGTTWLVAAGSQTLTSGHNWYGVHTLNSSDVWIGGDASLIAHWNGTAWSESQVLFQGQTTTWNDIFALGSDQAWAVGNAGAVVYWDGATWSEVHINEAVGVNLRSISYDGSSIWVAGDGGVIVRADAIPEPSTVAGLIGGGLLALVAGKARGRSH